MTTDRALDILAMSEQARWKDGIEPEDVKKAVETIRKALEQEPCWIPVSERLPKSNGVYVVSRWFSDGEESAILTDANYYDGNGDWYDDNRINWGRDSVTDKIVAWMPLPEPYKAESEGVSEC